MKTGVYKISCIDNHRFYIGSTRVDFNKRFTSHKYYLNKGIHANKNMQASWNKYGEISFSFDILEKCHPDSAYQREQFFIDLLKPNFNHLKIAYTSSFSVSHIGMVKFYDRCVYEILTILIKCNALNIFCMWTRTQREFFGLPAPSNIKESTRLKIINSSFGKKSGGKGKHKSEAHRNSQSLARFSYISKMKDIGQWPPSFYKLKRA